MGIIHEAAKIRSASDAQLRKRFDSWAVVLQNTLSADSGVAELRKAPLRMRVEASDELRAQGNGCFGEGQYDEALRLYIRAAGMLRWVETSATDLRKQGIKDSELTVRSAVPLLDAAPPPARTLEEAVRTAGALYGEDSSGAAVVLEEAVGDKPEPSAALSAAARSALVGAYNNASGALKMLSRFGDARAAACESLRADPANGKAMLRRAEASRSDPSSGAEALRMSVRDLRVSAAADPDSAASRRALRDAVSELKASSSAERGAFSGMFDRGEVVTEGEAERARAMASEAKAASASAVRDAREQERGGNEARGRQAAQALGEGMSRLSPEEERSLGEMIAAVEQLQKMGRTEEADALMQSAAALVSKAHGADGVRVPPVEWRNPTPEQVADAAKYGIDLTDPDVVEELEEMERRRAEEDGGKVPAPGGSTAAAGPADGVRAMAGRKRGEVAGGETAEPEEELSEEERLLRDVMAMPASELRGLLREHAGLSEEDAAAMKLRELRERAGELLKAASAEQKGPAGGASGFPRWARLLIVVLLVGLLLWRLHTTGLLEKLAAAVGLSYGAGHGGMAEAGRTAAAAAAAGSGAAGAGADHDLDFGSFGSAEVRPDGGVGNA